MSEILHKTTEAVNPALRENDPFPDSDPKDFSLDTDGIPGDGASDGGTIKATVRMAPNPVQSKPISAEFDGEMLAEHLSDTMSPGDVLEVRAFDAGYANGGYIGPEERFPKTFVGFYNNADSLAMDARRFKNVSVYVIPNPTLPDMLASSANKLKVAKKGSATKDEHIRCLRYLYLDYDPNKPGPDMSATDGERAAALGRRDAFLADHPDLAAHAIWGCSGNGGWILVRLPDYPNDQKHRTIVADVVDYAAENFGADTKTKNPARLMPLVGTVKCKGDPIPNRPYRNVTRDKASFDRFKRDAPFDLIAFHESVVKPSREATQPSRTPHAKPATSVPSSRAAAPVGDSSSDRSERIRRASAYVSRIAPAVSGQRGHDTTFDVACALVVEFDLTVDEARPIIQEWNRQCQPPWTDSELEHKLQDADSRPGPRGLKFEERPLRSVASGSAAFEIEATERPYMLPHFDPGGASSKWNMTDWGNAQRLVYRYGRNVRFCRDWGVWLVWTGSRWTIDRTGVIYRMARRAVLLINEEINLCADKEEKEAMFGWMMGSENKKTHGFDD